MKGWWNEIIVSFDVRSLFTKVKYNSEWPGLSDPTSLTAKQFEDLLRSIYFQYNGVIYDKKDSAALRSPVSIRSTFEEQVILSVPITPRSWKQRSPSKSEIISAISYSTSWLNNQPSVPQWTLRMMTQSLSLKPNSLEIRKNASLRMFTENLRTLIPLVLTGIHIRL